MVISQYQC